MGIRNAVAVFIFAVWMIPASAFTQVSPDEDHTVRMTYARLAMATEIKAVEDSEAITDRQLKSDVDSKALQFQITSLAGGYISEIADAPLDTIVSHYSGDVLDIATGETVNITDGVSIREQGAIARWIELHDLTDQSSTVTFRDALSYSELPSVTRYVRVGLLVTLEGRVRAYQSLFLFDQKGAALAFDPVAGSSAVNHFVRQAVYPHILLETTHYLNNPVSLRWLAGKQVSNCSQAATNECCDLQVGRCGISQPDLDRLTAKTLLGVGTASSLVSTDGTPGEGGPNVTTCSSGNQTYALAPYNVNDTAQHINGQHYMTGDSYGTCTYTNPTSGALCLTHATASLTAGMGESGSVSSMFGRHVTGSNYSNATADAVGGITTPAAIAAGAVQDCFAGMCTVSVGISGPGGSVSFPASAVWTHSQSYSVLCPAYYGNASGGGGGGSDPFPCTVYTPEDCPPGDQPLVAKPVAVPQEPANKQ